MKTIKKANFALLITLAGIFGQGCTKDKVFESTKEQNQTREKELVTIDFGSDGRIKFIEIEPGEILVDALLSPMKLMPEKANLNPLELYEFYKGDKAPKILLDAYEIAKRSPKGMVENDEVIWGSNEDQKSRMSGAVFNNKYCSGNWGYMYCKLNRTGTYRITRTSYSMYTVVSPYRGEVNHKFIYRSGGAWKTLVDRTVLKNWVSWAYQYGSIRKRQLMVSEGRGDGYHFAARGN